VVLGQFRKLAALVLCLVLWSFPVAAQMGLAGAASAASEPSPATAPALATLLEVLKDDAARAALIAELEATLATPLEDASAAAAPVETISVGRRIALITQGFGEDIAGSVENLWNGLQGGQSVFSGLRGDELGILLKALQDLVVVILITVSSFVLLRKLAMRHYTSVARRSKGAGSLRTIGLFIGSNLTDALVVIIAWTLGYAVTIFAFGEFGTIDILQSMYLNAFLIVEMTKVAIRAVLSPVASRLRLVPVSDAGARAVTRYLSFVVSVLGYGQLLIVPIVNQRASFAAGNGVSALISVLVLIYVVYIVLRRRRDVAAWLASGTEMRDAVSGDDGEVVERATGQGGLLVRLLHSVAAIWHWLALAYLGAMFAIVMTQPADRTLAAITGSAKILGAAILATLVSGWLARAVGRGITLPKDINAKLPLLENRINRFVPRAFGFLRLAILICVLLFSLDVLGLLDMRGWFDSQVGQSFTGKVFSVGAILIVAFGIWLAMTSFVDYKLNPEYGSIPTAREKTLLTLLRNATTIALVVFTLMFSLSEIGLDIGPLLASAGVLGLAIGFGAQKMVQDIITGIFIQFENAINVGDVITVSGITGAVERLSVRSVSLRDAHGVFHIIPFSSVDMVSNFMKEFSFHVCDMGIAYRESVEEAKAAMFDAFDILTQDVEMKREILAPLEWYGIQSFGDNAVVLRVRIKTVPGKQWAVGRAYNGILKEVFDARGIEIPFPQQTIWFGEAKDGSTQPIRLSGKGEPA
jgi:small-conductance mechanosensitive channel